MSVPVSLEKLKKLADEIVSVRDDIKATQTRALTAQQRDKWITEGGGNMVVFRPDLVEADVVLDALTTQEQLTALTSRKVQLLHDFHSCVLSLSDEVSPEYIAAKTKEHEAALAAATEEAEGSKNMRDALRKVVEVMKKDSQP